MKFIRNIILHLQSTLTRPLNLCRSAAFRTALLLSVFAFNSCEKATDWTSVNVPVNLIVMDGTITDELKAQVIRLTRPVAAPNDIPEPVHAAEVLVSSSDGIYKFIEDTTRPGYYISENPFAGEASKEYSLLIHADNNIISAKAMMEPGAGFSMLKYSLSSKTGLYRIVAVAATYNANQSAMYEILLDWSMVQGYRNAPPESTTARLLYYTLPTLDVNQVLAPEMESILFPPGTHITEKRYSLSDQHAAYMRSVLSITEWQGGLFNTVPANVKGNLSNNGAGFFAACAVTTKSQIAGSWSVIESPISGK